MADFTFAHREEGFDEHIENSIRGYSNLINDAVSFSRYFVEDGTNIIDIGCSTGKMTKALIDYNIDHCKEATYIGLEIADGFRDDLEKRKDLLKNIYDGLNCGGAYIFAEKTICENALVQDMITFNYYDYKRESFSTEDIMDKERTLRHMMKPNTWKEIEEMVLDAGFNTIQPFWRNHAFVGALAIK